MHTAQVCRYDLLLSIKTLEAYQDLVTKTR